MLSFITRGQFWPSGIVVACVCVCVGQSRASTNQPFKLESPNLDQRCKRPWLRSLLFWVRLTLNFKVKLNLKIQNLPHFQLVHAISHHQLKSVFPNFDQKYILACTLGGTAQWLQLQPSSAWPRPALSAFQYFRWCALTKHAVSHFLRRIYSLSKEEAL